MDLKTLADNFGILLDAPGAGQQLRELAWRLAITGALTQQDSREVVDIGQEPPCSALDAPRKRKVTSYHDRPSQRLLDLKIPANWQWIKLGDLGSWQAGLTPNRGMSSYYGDGLPWIKSGELKDCDLLAAEESITDKALAELSIAVNPRGSVLLAMYGANIGKVAILGIAAATNQAICACQCFSGVYNRYLFVTLLAYRRAFLSLGAGGAQPNISKEKIVPTLVPIPPLAEQHRIVAKVEQLMQLCNELEQKQEKASKARSRFNAASLEKLVTARDAAEFDECWEKVRENFNLHLQSPESIPPFKEALFTLAVQGRLVPQNSADESAHDAESKLEAFRESEKQPKSGTVAKSDFPISEHELPFPIPSNWTWVRLGTLAELITKGSSPRWQGVRYVDPSKEDGLLFITSTNVLSFELDLADPSYVEPRFNEIEPRSILRRGDFLMNLVGASIGRTAIYDRDYVANINQAVCLIRPLSCSGIFDPRYLLTFFNSPACIRYMFDKQVDMARANLSMTNVARFLVPLPPLPEQVRIVDKIKQISSALTTMSHQFTNKLSYETRLAKAMCRSALAPNDRLIRPTESDQSTRTSTHEAYTCS